jgi:hypothetical protein
MWEVRGQFSKPMKDGASTNLEWSAVLCDTAEEAETWWNCRMGGKSADRCVHTMFNPAGEVVQVKFN